MSDSTVKKYTYRISQLVSYWEYYEVEADSDEEALEIVCDSTPVHTEYRDSEESIIDEREDNCELTVMLKEYERSTKDSE